MKNSQRAVFVGIDQTGALASSGRPQSLASCSIQDDRITFFYLKSLSKRDLMNQVKVKTPQQLLLCVDCVLGLPKACDYSFFDALIEIKKTSSFGKKAAEEFFDKIGDGKILRRKIEVDIKANSVFINRPFQRNIQTGTFRCWKEFADHRDDFVFPALESSRRRAGIRTYEGYPTFSWKKVLRATHRDVAGLGGLVKHQYPELKWTQDHSKMVTKDPNLADAFVLALTLKIYSKKLSELKPNREGWILGVPEFLSSKH